MNAQFKKYITAISAALFLVVAASGLAMFFHVGADLVKEMHEWLAVIFVAAVGLHIFRNWGGMMTYVRRRTIVAPIALAAVAAAAFIVPAALSGGDDPRHVLMQSLQEAKLADLGRVLDVPADSLVARLEQKGFKVGSAEQRLSEIASGSGKPPMAALMTAVGAGPR
jgi:4-amino-4-deoxy-L-arabinose transferase-like glycosyltransferase